MTGIEELAQRTRTFVRWGLFMGVGFCIFLIPSVLTGGNRPLQRYGLTPLQIAAVYLASGILGGALIALLYPLKRWFLGAFLLGMLAALPAYLGLALLMRGHDPLPVTLTIGFVASFFVGGGLGTQISSESHSRPIPSSAFVMALWIVVGLCQVLGWYLGMRWPGETRGTIGLGLVFLPLFVALLATLSRSRRTT